MTLSLLFLASSSYYSPFLRSGYDGGIDTLLAAMAGGPSCLSPRSLRGGRRVDGQAQYTRPTGLVLSDVAVCLSVWPSTSPISFFSWHFLPSFFLLESREATSDRAAPHEFCLPMPRCSTAL